MNDYDYDDITYEEEDDVNSKKKKKDKKKERIIPAFQKEPKVRQLIGKIIPISPGKSDSGLYFQTVTAKYIIDMNEIGQKLKKMLYQEVMIYGIERKEGNQHYIKVSSFL